MGADQDEKHATRTIPLRDAIASSNANSLTLSSDKFVGMPLLYPPSPRYTPKEEEPLPSPSLESLLDEAEFWNPVVLPVHQEPCDGMISDYLELSEFDSEPAQSEPLEQAPILTDADVVRNQRLKMNEGFLRNCDGFAVSSGEVLGVLSAFDETTGSQNPFDSFMEDASLGLEQSMVLGNEVGDLNAPHEGMNLDGELYLRLWAAFPELTGFIDQSAADPQEYAALVDSTYRRAIQEAADFSADEPLTKNPLFSDQLSFHGMDDAASVVTVSDHPTPELDFSDFTDEETVTTPFVLATNTNTTNANTNGANKIGGVDPFDILIRDTANIAAATLSLSRKRSCSEFDGSDEDEDADDDEDVEDDDDESPTAKIAKRRKCNDCDESFRDMDHLITHRKLHIKETGINKCGHVDPVTKESCNKVFARSYDLFRHAVVHYPDVKKVHVCPICKKSFSRADALKRHHRTAVTCKDRATIEGLL